MKIKKLDKKIIEEKNKPKYKCNACKDLGYIQEAKGRMVHTCLACLRAGRLNQ